MTSSFDVEPFRIGTDAELRARHAGSKANVTDDDATVIAQIARARVNGFPDHYSRPAVVEADREGFWARGSSTRPK